MKCTSCGGALSGAMTFCSFCGVRQDVDLRQIHHRDLGDAGAASCPDCTTLLNVVEFDNEPRIQIERCGKCMGLFFNPGEMQLLLDHHTNPLVWLDGVQLKQISADFHQPRQVFYRKCPVCSEPMNHLNFGGRSGAIVDQCMAHGVWLEGSELRRLTEWWRAGGKLIYQESEARRVKHLYGTSKAQPVKEIEDLVGGLLMSGSDTSYLEDTVLSLIDLISD